MHTRATPLRIALAYALAGAAWIVVSDRAVEWAIGGAGSTLAAQTVKGLFFIGTTTLFVYWLARGSRRAAALRAVLSRTRADLRQTHAFQGALVDAAPDAIFVQVDGRIVFANPACARLLEAGSVDELLGLPVLDRVQPADREAVATRIRTLNEERTAVQSRAEGFITLRGREIQVEASATPIDYEDQRGALVFFRDITQRRLWEVERERLLRAVEQAGEAILVTDPSGRIEYVNPAFERISGFSREEAIGQNPRIQRSGQQDETFYRQMWDTVAAGEMWSGRVVNRRKDGTSYTVDTSISPVRDASGEIVNFVAVQRDVTRELEMESQLFRAQRMESIGMLAGGIAHDFNNMLTVIIGNLELTLDATPPEDPRRENLDEVRAAVHRSSELVGQLLGFARRQIIAPRTLDLNPVIEDRLGMLRRLVGEDLDFRWRPADELWAVCLDPAQVDQILINLVVNARDAIENVGRVTVETRNVEFDAAYCADHLGFQPGQYVLIAVSDTGCGMDRETKDRIFEPFFTTKSDDRGTGLGLSTVYGIVRQNEGFINVYSEPGEGTTFHVYLPRHLADGEPVLVPPPAHEARAGSETILLVEDEPALLRLAERQLRSLGYTVLPASGPHEAEEIIDRHEGRIHLLLTDVVMPSMNGRELCDRLSAKRPELKCLFMSGYTAEGIAHRGVLHANVHFLQKPFKLHDLAAALRGVLDDG